MNKKMAILLATYNGAKYIKEQLESILNQTYTNWTLFISDDGSADNTLAIIEGYCAKDNRIHVITNESKNQGACHNFGNLLENVMDEDWDFVMFADQDDYWYPHKIQQTLATMLAVDGSNEIPKLVYTDFEYADESLKPLKTETDKNTSTWKEPNLQRLLAENNIYGCTMMINRALAEKASPIPVCAENHDYWIALVAALLGSIVHVNHRTILYRQHSNNVSGHYSNNSIKARFRRYYKRNDSLEKIIRGRFVMAATLLDYFANEISTNNHSLLKTYSDFDKLGKFKRVYFCINNAIVKNNFVQNLAFYYSLLRL